MKLFAISIKNINNQLVLNKNVRIEIINFLSIKDVIHNIKNVKKNYSQNITSF